ncbi:iron-containing redox enzyme family protein [Leucobacter luti]|uniref:iron-containing redox enzyme family protein n=1 Tax=Leucobacter luti TaxID=340320 RepID=UPI003D04FC49
MIPQSHLEGATLSPRGPVSQAVLERLTGHTDTLGTTVPERPRDPADDMLHDDDLQAALFFLYASFTGSVPGLDPRLEWDPELIGFRDTLERAFEQRLREVVTQPDHPAPTQADVATALFALTADDDGPSTARFLAKRATLEQAEEFLIQKSIYTLREADPHSWAIPRLTGRAKAALVEIQSDEYGGGRPDRVHAEIYARTMQGAGLSREYGAYFDDVPAVTLASLNMMSMFGLNRRLLGAIVGHLAAFEMTSSIPNRLTAEGFRRLGFGAEVTDYFDEHVEADAVHEQIAARDLAGSLAEDHPELLPDIMFGAAACLAIDGAVATHMLDAWSAGESSLRTGARS